MGKIASGRFGLVHRGFSAGILLLSTISPSLAESNDTVIVFDASGSMWGQIDGQTKIEAARHAAREVLANWPENARLGVIAYGHRRKGDCKDIETIAPLSKVDSAILAAQIDGLNPKGKTPITASLKLAGDMLKSNENQSNIILISDGIETCQGDPCAAAEAIKASGVNFKAFVIGFDIGDAATKTQLQCIAAKTGGAYFDAKNSGELSNALKNASNAAQGQKVEVPIVEPAPAQEGLLRLRFSMSEDSDPIVTLQPSAELGWTVTPGEKILTSTSFTTPTLNLDVLPGDYEVALTFGAATGKANISVAGDKPVNLDLVLNAGMVFPTLKTLAEMAKPNEIFWELLNPANANERVWYSFDQNPRFIANQGGYVLQATIDAMPPSAQPLTIAAGDTKAIEFEIAAGAISFETPGANYVSFLPGGPDTLDFPQFIMSSVESGVRYIAPGTYKVLAEYDGGVTAEALAVVTSGKVTNVEIKPE